LEQRRAAERPRANRAYRCGIVRVAPQCCCRGGGRDLKPTDVTDLLLTHSHHDHSVNWTLFRHARILIGAHELAWSVNEPWGETPVPELYVRELETWLSLQTVSVGDEVLPGITAHLAPGHTPGHLIYLLGTPKAARKRASMGRGRSPGSSCALPGLRAGE
jgi:Metallo-beta-lactamase superfamily